MNNTFETCTHYLRINADFAELDKLRNFVINSVLALGMDSVKANLFALAVEEACTNLIKHSYNFDSSREITFRIVPQNKEIQVIIEDDGPSFNPLKVLPIKMEKIHKNLKKGGMGIFIISQIIDKMQYFPKDKTNSKNRLILTKKFV